MRAVSAALSEGELSRLLTAAGLDEVDCAAAVTAANHALNSLDLIDQVGRFVTRIRAGMGWFPGDGNVDPWAGYHSVDDPLGVGVLPLLSLLITLDDLMTFHRQRGISAAVSSATVAELGQQVRVHRRTYGDFGLHTYGWLPVTWSGSLYWLGRLQFNLLRLDRFWVCSTHLPRTGPLDPAAVDDSFASAADFFPRYFKDRPFTHFWCDSWLLDPQLAAALRSTSNIARFQRRWEVDTAGRPGDDDALFFGFGRREWVDIGDLPTDSSLQRALIDRWRSGGHWYVHSGRLGWPRKGT